MTVGSRLALGLLLVVACAAGEQVGGVAPPGTAPTPPSAPPPAGARLDTLVRQDFEALARLDAFFQDIYYEHADRGTIRTDAALAASGSRFLESSFSSGGAASGGALSLFLDGLAGRPAPVTNVRMEWSVFLPAGWQGGVRFGAVRGGNVRLGTPWDALGGAGACPQSRPVETAFFAAGTVAGEYGGNPGQVRFYVQWPGMTPQAGMCYGQGGQASGPWDYSRQREFVPGGWRRLAHEVQLNDVGQANGWQRIWLDGALVAEWTGLLWRTSPDVQISIVQLTPFVSTPVAQPTFQRIDDLIVTTRR